MFDSDIYACLCYYFYIENLTFLTMYEMIDGYIYACCGITFIRENLDSL